MKKTIQVKGMHCSSCEILLREAIEEKGGKVLSANHKTNRIEVEVKDEKQLDQAKKAIEAEGYAVE
jgi:copper chaperone CopZ